MITLNKFVLREAKSRAQILPRKVRLEELRDFYKEVLIEESDSAHDSIILDALDNLINGQSR